MIGSYSLSQCNNICKTNTFSSFKMELPPSFPSVTNILCIFAVYYIKSVEMAKKKNKNEEKHISLSSLCSTVISGHFSSNLFNFYFSLQSRHKADDTWGRWQARHSSYNLFSFFLLYFNFTILLQIVYCLHLSLMTYSIFQLWVAVLYLKNIFISLFILLL